MPVKKRKSKKTHPKKLRAEMREAVNQIPAMLAADTDKQEPIHEDLVQYDEVSTESAKQSANPSDYDEKMHSNRVIWLWGAVTVFTVLVVVMWFLNTRLIVKKYTNMSFNPLTNSQTELELVKKTLQSSELKDAVTKIRVSNTDIEISEMLKKEIPAIIAHLSPTSTTTTPELMNPTTSSSTTTTSTPSIETSTTQKFPKSNTSTIVTPSL